MISFPGESGRDDLIQPDIISIVFGSFQIPPLDDPQSLFHRSGDQRLSGMDGLQCFGSPWLWWRGGLRLQSCADQSVCESLWCAGKCTGLRPLCQSADRAVFLSCDYPTKTDSHWVGHAHHWQPCSGIGGTLVYGNSGVQAGTSLCVLPGSSRMRLAPGRNYSLETTAGQHDDGVAFVHQCRRNRRTDHGSVSDRATPGIFCRAV